MAPDLGRPVARLDHDLAHRVHTDLHALAPELVADLTGPAPRVAAPLGQDLTVALGLQGFRIGTTRGRRTLALGGSLDLAPQW